MKCYFIRHGQTMGNVLLNFNGCRTDEPLTEEGRAALKKIDDAAEDAVLFASPMKRAIETASIMLPGHEPTVIEDLRDLLLPLIGRKAVAQELFEVIQNM